MDEFTITTNSASATETLAKNVARMLPEGAVVALHGELAAGKTCFVRGMAQVLAPNSNVSSPTFTIINEYGDGPLLYHVDLYRLETLEEIADLGYEELFEGKARCAIEWAERAERLLPASRLDVSIEHAEDGQRAIRLINRGLLPKDWKQVLLQHV